MLKKDTANTFVNKQILFIYLNKDCSPMINHLACIMDGNRRWAQDRNKMNWEGHMQGMKAAELVIRWCKEKKIPYLSLYLFSVENFNRSEQEKHFLFYELFLQKAEQFMIECKKNNVRITFVGDRTLFPDKVDEMCSALEGETAGCDGLFLNLLFCYGGQQEIVAAAQSVAKKVLLGQLRTEDITVQAYAKELWSYPAPPPDVIIRSGGMQRLSNFLLFSGAYAELIFLPQMWPDITNEILNSVMEQFVEKKRTFGV